MEGWIKLHRKTLDNPIITKDSDYLAVWIYLLLNATHKEYDVLFKALIFRINSDYFFEKWSLSKVLKKEYEI